MGRNGKTIVLVILAFGILFTALLIFTMRSIGAASEDFNLPGVAPTRPR